MLFCLRKTHKNVPKLSFFLGCKFGVTSCCIVILQSNSYAAANNGLNSEEVMLE